MYEGLQAGAAGEPLPRAEVIKCKKGSQERERSCPKSASHRRFALTSATGDAKQDRNKKKGIAMDWQ